MPGERPCQTATDKLNRPITEVTLTGGIFAASSEAGRQYRPQVIGFVMFGHTTQL